MPAARRSFLTLALLALTLGAGSAPVPQTAPAFELPLLSGAEATLADYEGRTLLLHFWATWCKPCLEELPRLERAQVEHSDKMTILAVAVAEERPLVEDYLKKHPTNLPVALDRDAAVAERYGAAGLPSTIVVGPDGGISARFLSKSLDEAELERLLAELP